MKATFRYFVALCAFCGLLFAAPRTTEGRLAELEDRLDEIEFNSGLDKIKFGLDFSVGVSETMYKMPAYGVANADGSVTINPAENYYAHNKWAMELNLNMSANINDYTKFYGRLSMAKNFGMMDRNLDGGFAYSESVHNVLDIDAGRNVRVSGQGVYVSRAYVDLFLSPELVATLGRQPATEGPGANLRNNASRQATYPALLFNVLGDAAVVTYKPSFAKGANLAVRAAYGKIYQYDQISGVVRDWMSKQESVDSDLFYASAEIMPNLGGFAKSGLMMVSYVRIQDFTLDLSTSGGAGVENLGDADLANVHLEFHNMFRLPFHFFASGTYSNGAKARGMGAQPLSTLGITGASANDTIFNLKSGYGLHAGLRYDFHRLFKFGAEYFYGSRYFYTLTRPSINDQLNFRATRGNAYDVYVISQLDRNQFFRLSYTLLQNKWSYAGLPLGGAQRQESTAHNFMLIYNVKF